MNYYQIKILKISMKREYINDLKMEKLLQFILLRCIRAPLFSSGIYRISYYHNSLFKMVQEADSINNIMDSTVINTL